METIKTTWNSKAPLMAGIDLFKSKSTERRSKVETSIRKQEREKRKSTENEIIFKAPHLYLEMSREVTDAKWLMSNYSITGCSLLHSS